MSLRFTTRNHLGSRVEPRVGFRLNPRVEIQSPHVGANVEIQSPNVGANVEIQSPNAAADVEI
ncbi:hypothetical protein [Streptomyces sp. NPDC058086]|uniref:hypothetical protein n=1 Tax=Streptomyces sp. NPDC058086 TaxID=3346334 RepID=UPI0036E1C3B6